MDNSSKAFQLIRPEGFLRHIIFTHAYVSDFTVLSGSHGDRWKTQMKTGRDRTVGILPTPPPPPPPPLLYVARVSEDCIIRLYTVNSVEWGTEYVPEYMYMCKRLVLYLYIRGCVWVCVGGIHWFPSHTVLHWLPASHYTGSLWQTDSLTQYQQHQLWHVHVHNYWYILVYSLWTGKTPSQYTPQSDMYIDIYIPVYRYIDIQVFVLKKAGAHYSHYTDSANSDRLVHVATLKVGVSGETGSGNLGNDDLRHDPWDCERGRWISLVRVES